VATERSVWREVTQVIAVGVVVAVIVAVGLTFAVKVTLSSIDSVPKSDPHARLTPRSRTEGAGGTSRTTDLPHTHPSIVLSPASIFASPNEIVHLTGRDRHVTTRQRLHVQLRRHHRWVTFPLPAMTDASGRFTAFVELARSGPNRVRVIDRRTGDVSNTATVIVS
jgi:hypothetical protein